MTLGHIKSETRDLFSYILLGCPNFPLGTGSTVRKEFEKLLGLVDTIMQRTKSQDSKQWLRICMQEVRGSRKQYEDGNIVEGKELIQRAEEYFDHAFSKKPISPRFVAGESAPPLDNEKGFPT